jgi:hypothetical protein
VWLLRVELVKDMTSSLGSLCLGAKAV